MIGEDTFSYRLVFLCFGEYQTNLSLFWRVLKSVETDTRLSKHVCSGSLVSEVSTLHLYTVHRPL